MRRSARYKEEYDLPDYDIDIITGSKHLADLFEATIALGSEPKEVSNWLMGETMRLVNESEMELDDVAFAPEHLAKLIEMIKNSEINRKVGKEVFEKIFKENIDPAAYVEEHGLKSMNDEGALRAAIEEIVKNNPKSVEDYKSGKKKAIGFLVGQTMKRNPGESGSWNRKQNIKRNPGSDIRRYHGTQICGFVDLCPFLLNLRFKISTIRNDK